MSVRPGTRVRLKPRPRSGDVWDLVLAGKVAIVDAVETTMDGEELIVVVVEDDPGRDLARKAGMGHRFFFSPSEVEPLPACRILVAGIGNVFLGDDGFGVALAELLAVRPLAEGVEVVDFGIRGMDLAYALGDGWDAAVLLDATPRGQAPGTLYVIEPELDPGEVALDTHGMDPVKVLATARALGGDALPRRTLVVGCEPLTRMTGDEAELVGELSAPVRASLAAAVELVEELLRELTTTQIEEARP